MDSWLVYWLIHRLVGANLDVSKMFRLKEKCINFLFYAKGIVLNFDYIRSKLI